MSAVLLREREDGKIQGRHRDRLAVVYVRQSSRQQVLDHGESTRLQYGLVERAVALGWASSRVMVIDEDLGRSAANAAERPGFARLVTEITMGHVGLVLGIEMSRLARAGHDWHQLIELCSLSGALLADTDGVYDPNWYNDRLLLGLKGTLSEVELHLIKQRMASGRLAKAGRGELAFPLPAGYVRRPSGEVALDPDEQVRNVVRLVFHLFEQLQTVHAVLRFLVEHQVQIGMRERSGPGKGELVWRAPHQQGLLNMLRNPAYAGIYAYGRSRTDPGRRLPGQVHSGRVRAIEAGGWLVRIPDALPAYISIEQYERNLARMAANRARAVSAGAPRQGPALLAGLVACGICGHRMQVSYEAGGRGQLHRYSCQRPGKSRPTGRRSNGSGASAWNAPHSPATGPGASTSWPSRKTAWSPGSWRATGKTRWPHTGTWPRTTNGSRRIARPSSARRSWPQSARWPRTSRRYGPLRRPPTPTARSCCAPWSSRSRSPPTGRARRYRPR